jgi:predicted enzyme related to lactoylglutathione lyase
MGQPVVQWQILAKNPDQLASFYSKVFGWKANSDNALGYRTIETGADRGINGGIWPAPPEGRPMVTLYVEWMTYRNM